eukprot:549687_1
MSSVIIRWLQTNSEIEEAEKILYNITIKNAIHPWKFSKHNESEIMIMYTENGEHRLVDKYRNVAKWIGAFVDNKLVGCVRTIVASPATKNKLEMQTYSAFPKSISDKINVISKDYKYRVETNRMALLSAYRRRNILHCMVLFICKWASEINAIIWGTFPINYYQSAKPFWSDRFGFKKVETTFKYEPTDPTPVYVLYLQRDPMQRIVARNNSRIKHVKYDKKARQLQEICFICSQSKL